MKSFAALALVVGVTSLSSLSSAARAAEPTVVALDAWGRFVNSIELDYRSGDKRWSYTPKGRFLFLVEKPESDDIVLARFTMNGKPFGDALKCPITGDAMAVDDSRSVVVAECKPDLDKLGVDKAATFAVTLGYRQTQKGVDHADLATYRFDVKSHEDARKGVEFHVDHDFRIGEAWGHMKQDGTFELFTWFKVDNREASRVDLGKLRCKVGDKAFEVADQVNERWSSEHEDYAKRDASGNPTRVRWTYNAWFSGNDPKGFFAKNPGEYRCSFTRNGELDRELSFTVADGKLVKPACQKGAKATVRTPASTTLIRVALKTPQDGPFDPKAFDANGLAGRGDVRGACGL